MASCERQFTKFCEFCFLSDITWVTMHESARVAVGTFAKYEETYAEFAVIVFWDFIVALGVAIKTLMKLFVGGESPSVEHVSIHNFVVGVVLRITALSVILVVQTVVVIAFAAASAPIVMDVVVVVFGTAFLFFESGVYAGREVCIELAACDLPLIFEHFAFDVIPVDVAGGGEFFS
jgi:hypothetical protein